MTRLLSVKQAAIEHPAFKESRLRHLIADSDNNGFDRVFSKKGGRIYIDEDELIKWAKGK